MFRAPRGNAPLVRCPLPSIQPSSIPPSAGRAAARPGPAGRPTPVHPNCPIIPTTAPNRPTTQPHPFQVLDVQLQGLGPLGGPLFASPRGRGSGGPSVSLLIGDPWLGGARAQLDLPYAPRWVRHVRHGTAGLREPRVQPWRTGAGKPMVLQVEFDQSKSKPCRCRTELGPGVVVATSDFGSSGRASRGRATSPHYKWCVACGRIGFLVGGVGVLAMKRS